MEMPKRSIDAPKRREACCPEGLQYTDGWDKANPDHYFQLMESAEPHLSQQWLAEWQDLAEFEVIPVVASTEAAVVGSQLS